MIKMHPTLPVLCNSETGEVLRFTMKRLYWTKGWVNGRGYLRVHVEGRDYSVHRLMLETFVENVENKPEVDHINRVKTDNRLDNLRWVTPVENVHNTHRYVGAWDTSQYTDYRKDYAKDQVKHQTQVRFPNGKRIWINRKIAWLYTSFPLRERPLVYRIPYSNGYVLPVDPDW